MKSLMVYLKNSDGGKDEKKNMLLNGETFKNMLKIFK